jgi:hypothetical protein
MMTPPLSISAMPRLTRDVPVVGVGVLSWADTGYCLFRKCGELIRRPRR